MATKFTSTRTTSPYRRDLEPIDGEVRVAIPVPAGVTTDHLAVALADTASVEAEQEIIGLCSGGDHSLRRCQLNLDGDLTGLTAGSPFSAIPTSQIHN